jgi:peptidoglycan/xylan/chitin deacetylase (PgdA/CDA1 family)
MRSTVAGYILLASLIGIGAAGAAECPPGALGTSRTIVVDPNEHVRLGSMQYGESLPLKDREVVLTFDDGPLPPYTNRILDTLASECVKATFFMVGRMVRGYPSIVRRIYNEGHTVANHSQSHPFTFHKMSVDKASVEIEEGFASLQSALGDPKAVAPFFRIPGLLRQNSVEQYLASRGVMTWSVDFLADDWTHINAKEIAKRAISRVEARGKGILLLHDIQPATALAFPEILQELKARGFKIVHVVPATADQPKTVTEPEQWVARRPAEQKIWSRTLVVGLDEPEPVLSAPNPASFGIENFGTPVIKVALAQTFEQHVVRDGGAPLPPVSLWPDQTVYAVPADTRVLPVPGRQNFRWHRTFRLGGAEKSKLATKKHPPAGGKPKDPASTGSVSPAATANRPRFGHQLSVVRPPMNLTSQPATANR